MDMRVTKKPTVPHLGVHSRRSLALLASIIGRKRNVKVVFGDGWDASTDGETMYLPRLSHNASADDAVLLEGLMDHESMHCRFTNFAHLKSAAVKRVFKQHPMIFPLFNTFEDVWGEREQSKVYPGCFRNIKRSVEVMIAKKLYGGPDGPAPVELALRNFVLQALLGRLYDNVQLQQFGAMYRVILEGHIGPAFTERIWNKALEVDLVISTEMAVQLAVSIFEMIKDELASEEQSNEKNPKREDSLRTLVTNAPEDLDIASLLAAALSATGGVVPNGASQKTPGAVYMEVRDELTLLSDDLTADVRQIAVRLGSRLEVLLEGRVHSNSSYIARGRRLAPRRVPRIALGERNLFRHIDEEDGLNTYVHILLDLSGSMYHTSHRPEPHVVAKSAVLALGDVLDRFSIPFGVSLFGSSFTHVKLESDRWQKVRPFIHVDTLGGTRTVSALSKVLEVACVQPESRRLVLLLTDGESDDGNQLLVPVANELTAAGIEFSAVQIGYQGTDLEEQLSQAGYSTERAKLIEDVPQAIFNAIRNAV